MEKHYFDIGLKIANKRRMPSSIINNKHNLERYVILQILFLHFADVATPEGILEQKLGDP